MHRPSSVRVIAAVAAAQDGVVARPQLLAAGLTRHEIQGHVSRGLLRPALRGIYVLGAGLLSHRQFLRCALLHAGPPACLAERSAAEQLELLRLRAGRAVVVAPASKVKRLLWTQIELAETGGFGVIIVRCSTTPVHWLPVDGLPTTAVARTLVDLAGAQPARVVGWAWNEAEFRGILEVEDLTRELAGSPRAGTRVVRRLLAAHRAVTTPTTRLIGRDELPFLKRIAAAALPAPAVNVPMQIAGQQYVADFYWPDHGLVVELDDPGHLKPSARDRDVIRDAEFFNANLDVLRFLTTRVDAEPARCMSLLRGALDRKAPQNTPAAGV